MISESEWSLIGDALKTGSYNLLLGAGVSLDSASGIINQNCPSAGKLAEILQTALPNVRKGSSLNRLYRSMSEEQVLQQITSRFSGCKPGETVDLISNFRWKRVFTLNVDDALEAAYEARSTTVQQSKSLNYKDAYESIRDLRVLPIIHVHGFARHPEDGYVFDQSEYARSMVDNNIWAHVLSQLIRTEPFLVLGTSLEEPDLAYFLSQRLDVRARADLAPSIFVEPFPDAATLNDCDEFKLKLYHGFAKDFLIAADLQFPIRLSVTDAIEDNLAELSQLPLPPNQLAEFSSDFELIPKTSLPGNDGGPNFAYGHQATWVDLQNSRDLDRPESAKVQAVLTRNGVKEVSIVTGGPGAGKSTTLRRVAWNMAQAGRTCFWVRSLGRVRTSSAAAVLNSIQERKYIFVDNFADHALDMSALKSLLKHDNTVIIGAERTYRFEHVKRLMGSSFDLVPVYLGPIGIDIATRLNHSYVKNGLGKIKNNNRAITSLGQELIAIACCRVLNDFEPLSSIIDRSVRHAPKDVDCYIFAALASHCNRQGIEYDIISQKFPNYQVDLQVEGDGPLPLKLTSRNGVDFTTPQNEAVSDAVLRRFAAQETSRMLGIFIGVALAIRSRVNVRAIIEGEPCARIASRLFDFDEVVMQFLGLQGAVEFFEKTKSDWDWNSRYWQQRAQLELERASVARLPEERNQHTIVAVQHARFAKEIEPDHQFSMTSIGRTIFGRMKVLKRINPIELADAINSLGRAINIEKNKGRVTVHPFMIMFKGISEAIESGAVLSSDQQSSILSYIDRAHGEFRQDRDILEEAKRVKILMAQRRSDQVSQ